MKKKVIFRADGNKIIGFGHIFRLLALAQILKEDFECKFVIAEPEEFIINQIKSSGFSLISLPPVQYIAPDLKKAKDEIPFDLKNIISKNDIVVTDGYWFGENYQKAVKAMGSILFCVDDLAEHHFVADYVINHAEGIKPESYNLSPFTKLLSGYDFLLLRPEFFSSIERKEQIHKNTVLITMGGSDNFGLNYLFTKIIAELKSNYTINVIMPSGADEIYVSKFLAMQEKYKMLNLHYNLSALEIVKLIDTLSHAIVSASTVLLEVNARGLKPLTGYYTNNQKSIYYGSVNSCKAEGLGDLLAADKNNLKNKVHHYLLNSPEEILQPNGTKIKERYIHLFKNPTDFN